jgi:hypothetical protein
MQIAGYLDAPRQAHETAIHRADAQSAAGTKPEYPAEFAADGINELIMGFGRRRKYAPVTGADAVLTSWQSGVPGALELISDDTERSRSGDRHERTTLVRLDDKLRVATSPALIGDLKQLLGPACVS